MSAAPIVEEAPPPSTVQHPDPSMQDVTRVWTLQELSRYGGSQHRPDRLLISFNGLVYDVSSAARTYGKGGAYGMTSGRDASRSFCVNCFRDTCLLPDLRDMTPEQNEQIEKWQSMFERTYPRVGRVAKSELSSTDEQLAAANASVEEVRRLHAM